MFLWTCLYFFLVLEQLVSKGSVAGLESCNCRCNNTNSEVCDELLKVKTLAHANGNELITWKQYVPLMEKKYRQWMAEDSSNSTSDFKTSGSEERVNDLQNKVQQLTTDLQNERKARLDFEDVCISSTSEVKKRNVELETKLRSAELKVGDTEIEVAQLKTHLDAERKARIDFEVKMAEFEKKLLDVTNKAVTLESHIKNEIEGKVATQEEIIRNVSSQQLILEKKDADVQTKLSSMEGRLEKVENRTRNFASSIKVEKEVREKLQEETSRTRNRTESRFADFLKSNSSIFEKLRLIGNRTFMLRPEDEKNFMEELERTMDELDRLILNFEKTDERLDERLKVVEKKTEGIESLVKDLGRMEAPFPGSYFADNSQSEVRNSHLLWKIRGVEEKVRAAEEGVSDLQSYRNAFKEVVKDLCQKYSDTCFVFDITERLL